LLVPIPYFLLPTAYQGAILSRHQKTAKSKRQNLLMHEEDDVKKSIIITIVALAFPLAIIAGCGNETNQVSNIPATPKWKGAPYRLSFGAPPAKPGSASLTIPPIKFTANPDMLETRANLVVQFDTSSVKRDTPVPNMMIMGPTDISGADGAVSADYLDTASKELAKMLGSYCMNGKIKISVALTRSSIPLNATDDQVNSHRLSDWLPTEIDFKNPHPKC
jgi:hypothetical protein